MNRFDWWEQITDALSCLFFILNLENVLHLSSIEGLIFTVVNTHSYKIIYANSINKVLASSFGRRQNTPRPMSFYMVILFQFTIIIHYSCHAV